jgi:hypothetical protein
VVRIYLSSLKIQKKIPTAWPHQSTRSLQHLRLKAEGGKTRRDQLPMMQFPASPTNLQDQNLHPKSIKKRPEKSRMIENISLLPMIEI